MHELSRQSGRINCLKPWDDKTGVFFPGKRKLFFLPGLQIKFMSTFYFYSRTIVQQDSLKGKIPVLMIARAKKTYKLKIYKVRSIPHILDSAWLEFYVFSTGKKLNSPKENARVSLKPIENLQVRNQSG